MWERTGVTSNGAADYGSFNGRLVGRDASGKEVHFGKDT